MFSNQCNKYRQYLAAFLDYILGLLKINGMGKELGGGFRMGNTCTPMADSSQCMAKPIQCCKVK